MNLSVLKLAYRQGCFTNGFKGVAATFVTASYSMGGTEMVGLTAAEVENPRKVLPKAVRQVFGEFFILFLEFNFCWFIGSC